jgi:hypothetical protein
MLRVLGSVKQLCQGFSRRDMLRAGGLGLAGMNLPQMLSLQEASAVSGSTGGGGFGKAKNVILIHLYGAPSQIEWLDPKPDAPTDVRGELGSIESALPGCRVGELFPQMSKVMDRVTLLRSLTHPYPIHGVAYALTGIPSIDVSMELSPYDGRHWPFFGSALEFAEREQRGNRPIPPNIALPFRFSSKRTGEVHRAGPYGGFLGAQYDPLWTEFQGVANKGIRKTLQQQTFDGPDPYVGLEPDAAFSIPAALLQPELTLDRLDNRRTLLGQLNDLRRPLATSATGRAYTKHQQAAISLLESKSLAEALDIRREPVETRELYGSTLFGQSCLAARRLVEAGSRVVTVFWDEFGLAGSGWDTHWDHYQRMKVELAPGFDQGWYGLINDLDRRGLLDETLVVCTSEHGRTPKITPGQGGGRDHWSRVYSSMVAGGGTARGCIVGASDRQAGDVADRQISPKDLLATMYHLLGIDPHMMINDRQGRPLPLVTGSVVDEMIA